MYLCVRETVREKERERERERVMFPKVDEANVPCVRECHAVCYLRGIPAHVASEPAGQVGVAGRINTARGAMPVSVTHLLTHTHTHTHTHELSLSHTHSLCVGECVCVCVCVWVFVCV